MRILFVGDIHNHSYIFDRVKQLDTDYNFNRIIFIGDYVDDWNTDNHYSLYTLDRIINLKKNNPEKYTLLLGNHELSYLGYPCSGHQKRLEEVMETKLRENITCFDLYTTVILDNKEYICTHAGITNAYIKIVLDENRLFDILHQMNDDILNNLYKLDYRSVERGGNYEFSSFIWTDIKEHINATEDYIIPNQIVGHSPVTDVYNINLNDNTGKLYFIDTHSTYNDGTNIGDKSYLMWNEDKFEIIK